MSGTFYGYDRNRWTILNGLDNTVQEVSTPIIPNGQTVFADTNVTIDDASNYPNGTSIRIVNYSGSDITVNPNINGYFDSGTNLNLLYWKIILDLKLLFVIVNGMLYLNLDL